MIFILPFVFGAVGLAVGAVAGAFTSHAAGEKDRQSAKHHRKVANELVEKYTNLEKKYYELADESRKQIDDLIQQIALSEVEKDCLRVALLLQQYLIYLMWEIDREPTADTLNEFQTAVEQTNQVLEQLQEELIIVPNDYYESLLKAIKVKDIEAENIREKTLIKEAKLNDIFSKTILSVDLGRTATKTCVSLEPGNVGFIPSPVKQMSIKQIRGLVLEAKGTDPLMNLWIEYQDIGYAVGQLAEDFGANLGVGQSTVEDALIKVLSSAGYFKLKDEIAVVLSLPFVSLDQFEDEKAHLNRLLIGFHVMNFRGELVSLNITKIWVMPNGFGSLIWSECQPNKWVTLPDFTKISVGIVDIGHQTIDMIMADNFRFVKYLSKSEDFGMSEFYTRIAKEIEGADSQSLALIEAVNKPKGERFYRPKGANKPTNLDDFLPNLTEMFSREFCSLVLAWLPERVTDVIITGGGGEFFWEDIQRLLKEAKIKAYLAAPSRQANVLGQYIYGEIQFMRAARSEN